MYRQCHAAPVPRLHLRRTLSRFLATRARSQRSSLAFAAPASWSSFDKLRLQLSRFLQVSRIGSRGRRTVMVGQNHHPELVMGSMQLGNDAPVSRCSPTNTLPRSTFLIRRQPLALKLSFQRANQQRNSRFDLVQRRHHVAVALEIASKGGHVLYNASFQALLRVCCWRTTNGRAAERATHPPRAVVSASCSSSFSPPARSSAPISHGRLSIAPCGGSPALRWRQTLFQLPPFSSLTKNALRPLYHRC